MKEFRQVHRVSGDMRRYKVSRLRKEAGSIRPGCGHRPCRMPFPWVAWR